MERKSGRIRRVKYWEIIADNLSKAGWSWGCVSAIDRQGRTIWIADAHRGDGKRFVVCADEMLITFLELETQLGTSSDWAVALRARDLSSMKKAPQIREQYQSTPRSKK